MAFQGAAPVRCIHTNWFSYSEEADVMASGMHRLMEKVLPFM